jgi:hypothetical protein
VTGSQETGEGSLEMNQWQKEAKEIKVEAEQTDENWK